MKQITASNIQEALTLARRELGEDAVLLDTRQAGKGPGIIVTFAVEDEDADFLPQSTQMNSHSYAPAANDDALSADILPFASDAPTKSKVTPTPHTTPDHPALTMIVEAVKYHAIPLDFAEKLLLCAYRLALKPLPVIDAAEAALAEALAGVMLFKPFATHEIPERGLMFVGPYGCGKTTAIGKLATQLTLNKRPVVLVACDLERLGAADSLQQLADILKCPFVIAENRAALKTILAKHLGRAWVLIDSTGANIYEFAQLKTLGELAGLQQVEPILACPAGMDILEAQEMASVFHFLSIERAFITRLDAVRRLGSLFSATYTGGFALTGISDSAVLTEPCVPMTAARLSHFMLRHVRARSVT